MKTFWVDKSKVGRQWVPLPQSSRWLDNVRGFTIDQDGVADRSDAFHDKGNPPYIKAHLLHQSLKKNPFDVVVSLAHIQLEILVWNIGLHVYLMIGDRLIKRMHDVIKYVSRPVWLVDFDNHEWGGFLKPCHSNYIRITLEIGTSLWNSTNVRVAS